MPDDDQTADAPGLLEDVGGTRAAAVDTAREEQKKGKELRLKKSMAFLEDLLTKLDYVVYAELSALYYMDCSFFQFLLRALVQLIFLTPKSQIFGETPRNRPYVGAIFGTNILCIVVHILSARPEAGEAMRGYLHGGIFIDFVGEKGPISKSRLLLFDVITLLLQVVMLAVFVEQQTLKATLSGPSTTARVAPTTRGQDHDSEERGVVRSHQLAVATSSDDIELQPLARSSTGRTGGEEDGERDELLAEPSDTGAHPNTHALDNFYTGTMVVSDLHLLDTIRNQWWQYQTAPATESSSSDQSGYISFPGGRLAIRMRVGGRQVGTG